MPIDVGQFLTLAVTMTGIGDFMQRENPDAVARHPIQLFTGDPATLADITDRSLR